MIAARALRLPAHRRFTSALGRTVVLAGALQAVGLSPVARAGYLPPDCQPADPRSFTDVAFDHPSCAWIEQLARDQISLGCAAGRYCPDEAVTRAQVAMLLERVMRGTDAWTSTPRLRFACGDANTDCTEPQGELIPVNVFLDDPAYLGSDHLVRLWVANSTPFGGVGSADSTMVMFASQFQPAANNVLQVVMGGANSMTVVVLMNSVSTRYLMVEIGGRIFTSPVLTWEAGPT